MNNRQSDFNNYRQNYHTFYYHGYNLEINDDTLHITYLFEIEGLSSFSPDYYIPLHNHSVDFNDELLNRYIFSLGMVELISYYKITCPKVIKVECGSLDDYQIEWFKKLTYYGLGEFLYINNISISMEDLFTIITDNKVSNYINTNKHFDGELIPVGGGKDSYVTLDILKNLDNTYAFVINDVISALNSVNVSGYDNRFIHVKRNLDKNMLELNKQGYLNGHTPFSAMVAFCSVLVSYIYNLKYICLSNESSANESTIKGEKINHQYSKTFEFENDFALYNEKYLCKDIAYFSFLRALNELQITRLFTLMPKYLTTFRSCNVGSKQGIWCGKCAKCCFVAIMLSAFIDDDDIYKVFGKEILNDESLWPVYQQLAGIVDDKPFECVGTRAEVNAAIMLAINLRKGKKLPFILEKYSQYIDLQQDYNILLHEENKDNLIPQSLYNHLAQRCVEANLWKK